jgi:hypothetical protein
MFRHTKSALVVGVLNADIFGPTLAFSVLDDMLTDRLGAVRVIVATHVCAFVVGTAPSAAAFAGYLNTTVLVISALLFGCSYALAKPSLGALAPLSGTTSRAEPSGRSEHRAVSAEAGTGFAGIGHHSSLLR